MFLVMFLCISLNLCASCQDVPVCDAIADTKGLQKDPAYELIREFLRNYTRDFTVLDMDATQDLFSLKIGDEFPHATCVVLEHSDTFLGGCLKNETVDNIIFLKTPISVEILHTLSQCEHFDLILALHCIDHCGHEWKTMLEKIVDLGDYVIIENTSAEEGSQEERAKRHNVEECIAQKGGVLLGEIQRTTSAHTSKIFLVKGSKSKLHKRNIFWPPPCVAFIEDKSYEIRSDFSKKELIKICNSQTMTTTWHKGINLLTFKALNGMFPLAHTIRTTLLDHAEMLMTHRDLTPANIILQGESIQVIDIHDFHYVDTEDDLEKVNQERLAIISTFLDIYGPKELYAYYWAQFMKM